MLTIRHGIGQKLYSNFPGTAIDSRCCRGVGIGFDFFYAKALLEWQGRESIALPIVMGAIAPSEFECRLGTVGTAMMSVGLRRDKGWSFIGLLKYGVESDGH